MGKVNSNTAHNHNINVHQQPKIKKENKPAKAQPQAHTQTKVNVKAAESVQLKNDLSGNLLRLKLEKKLDASIAAKPKKTEVKVTYVPSNKRHRGTEKLSIYDTNPHKENRTSLNVGYKAVNPKTKLTSFPLNDGKHLLYDGNGLERGTISKDIEVRLNYGIVKKINNEDYYYALAVPISYETKSGENEPKTETMKASGWIKASSIEKGNKPLFTKKEPPHIPQNVNDKSSLHKNYQEYVVKNVRPQDLKGADGKPKYGYMENNEFVSYKVLPGKDESNIAASDYLLRNGNVINLGFNAAGMSNDTFKVGEVDANGQPKPVVFHRAPTTMKGTTIDIDLYHPKDKNHAGQKPVGKMRFVYGYVETQGQKRWGWMALGALEQKK